MGSTSQGNGGPAQQNPGDVFGLKPTPPADLEPNGDAVTVELTGQGGGRFQSADADGQFTVLSLAADLFERLGEPETVTVLIESAE